MWEPDDDYGDFAPTWRNLWRDAKGGNVFAGGVIVFGLALLLALVVAFGLVMFSEDRCLQWEPTGGMRCYPVGLQGMTECVPAKKCVEWEER